MFEKIMAFEIDMDRTFQEKGYQCLQQKIEQKKDSVTFIDQNFLKSECHPFFELEIEYVE